MIFSRNGGRVSLELMSMNKTKKERGETFTWAQPQHLSFGMINDS
jgi:hypothetical protein